jgi:DNA-binding transcriptional ArsR family regulator
LSAKPLSVSELSKKLGAEQSRLSHSLQMLRTCNYVAVESKGKQRIYRLNPVIEGGLELKKSRANVFEYMDSHIMTCCNNHCNKLVQLK